MSEFFFIFDHTIFNDVYRNYENENDNQKYAKFIHDYLIIRKAMVRKKMIYTSREIFERIVSRTQINPKLHYMPNLWVAVNNLVNISGLTYNNPEILYKDSIILLSVDLSFKCSEEIILLSNSGKCPDKVLILYAKYGRPLRTIEEAPFKIMNCEKAIEYLKENDKSFFDSISDMLKENYDFL